MPLDPKPVADERLIQAFVSAERRLESHMNAFVQLCSESKDSGRILTYPELIDFRVKYNILMDEQCATFMGLHLIGCKLQGIE